MISSWLKLLENWFSSHNSPLSEFSTIESDRIEEFHKKIGNNETPLIRLNALAKHLGVGSIFLKDESQRFGLNSFKALGSPPPAKKSSSFRSLPDKFSFSKEGNSCSFWIRRNLVFFRFREVSFQRTRFTLEKITY